MLLAGYYIIETAIKKSFDMYYIIGKLLRYQLYYI